MAGPLPALLAPGTRLAPAPAGLPGVIGLTEGGSQIDTTRLVFMAPGFDAPLLLTLAPGVRGNQLTGTMTLHNGTGRPLGGVRLDLVGLDAVTGPAPGRHAARAPEGEPLFFGDVGRGVDTAPIPFSFGPVQFDAETSRVELYLNLSGYRISQFAFEAESLSVAPVNPGEGLDAPATRMRVGDLFQTMGFSRCACQIDTIRAQGRGGQDLVTPPVRGGAGLGGLNRLTACDVNAADQLFVADRQFADDDSTHLPLGRVSQFDAGGRFVTAFGWGDRDALPPYAIPGRLLEPEGMATLKDGRVAVRTKPGGRQRARVFIYSPFATMTKVIPPR